MRSKINVHYIRGLPREWKNKQDVIIRMESGIVNITLPNV